MTIFVRYLLKSILGLATAAFVVALPLLYLVASIGSMLTGDSPAKSFALALGIPGLALCGLWAIGLTALRAIGRK
jgi:hypothetical protein